MEWKSFCFIWLYTQVTSLAKMTALFSAFFPKKKKWYMIPLFSLIFSPLKYFFTIFFHSYRIWASSWPKIGVRGSWMYLILVLLHYISASFYMKCRVSGRLWSRKWGILRPGGHINGYFPMQMAPKHRKDHTVLILSHFMHYPSSV